MADQEPEHKSSIGVLFLLLVLGFAVAVYVDLGGIGTQMGLLIKVPLGKDPPVANLPILAEGLGDGGTAATTQAWFIDASGYEGAEAERASTRVPIIVYFHKRGCDACHRFEHELLGAPEVKHTLASLIKVRVDTSSSDRESRLAQRLGVSDLPALVLIAPNAVPRLIPLKPNGAQLTPAQLIATIR